MQHADLDTLGLCENCGKVIFVMDYAGSEGSETWHCRHCGQTIEHSSFGFDKPDEGCRKVRWVGPEGEWVRQRPEDTFKLGRLTVYVEPPRFA